MESGQAAAAARSNGLCQFCGIVPATSGHHWALEYPALTDITADDVTMLCDDCHYLADYIRKQWQRGEERRKAAETLARARAEKEAVMRFRAELAP